MNMYDAACIIAAFLILITALARLNDIKRSQSQKRWWVRRLGLLMVFVAMAMYIAGFFTTYVPYWRQIQQIMTLWGVLLTWMTTPGMPPWHKYIASDDSKPSVPQ